MNGIVDINPLAGFEIVTDIGGGRWFGKVSQDDDEQLLLNPAWEMAPRIFVPAQQPNGQPTVVALMMPNIFPVMDRPSSPQVLVRWASRVAVSGFSPDDQRVFREILKQSETATRAARAGLTL